MKGDISADFHAPEKRYSGVRAQQGRVLTDADFNAAMDVVDDTVEALVRTLVCAAGTPDGGFSISDPTPARAPLPNDAAPESYDFTIAPGVFVLGGRAQLLHEPVSFLGQPDWLNQVLDLDDLPPAPEDGRHDLVYLESIVQPVRAVEDREIQERALGSADTTTRLRPELKVRVFPDTVDECMVAATALRAMLAGSGGAFSDDGTELLSNARLSIGFDGTDPVDDPCAPRTIAGYLGAENQTLKVMLTEPGRFVWNYDHGEPLHRIQVDVAASEVVFLTEPKDPVLFPRAGQVIEILPWGALLPNGEKKAAPVGHLARLTGEYNPPERTIAYDGTMPEDWQAWLDDLPASVDGRDDEPPRYFYARIWAEPNSGGVDDAAGAGVSPAQTGLMLTFSGTGFAGDYWTAALRPDAPELVVPWQLLDPAGAAPVGPRRFYAPLALLRWSVQGDGERTAAVEDCRNRFRRLCQIKSCCTYTVGDGRSTFGEFNDIQAALDALPPEGGDICLLPGLHEGRVDLRGRRRIVVHGCGARTIVTPADTAETALFRLSNAEDITLRDFSLRTTDSLAVSAENRAARITLRHLDILVTGGAIDFRDGQDVRIDHCRIRSRLLPRALTPDDIERIAPLVYLRGETLIVENCEIAASTTIPPEEFQVGSGDVLVTREANRNRVVLGGLQIGGESRQVRIRDNVIAGGNGNGVTLGSAAARDPTGQPILINPFFGYVTVDRGGCLKLDPPGSHRPPPRDPDGPPIVIESEGPVIDLRIEGNRIEEQGASGIAVAYWFVAEEDDDADELDDIEIEDAVIADNVIQRCMVLDLVAALPVEAAFGSAFGGVALSSAVDLQIENNDIRRCGAEGRTSLCGIFIRYGERLHITANRIYDNGRPATLKDPLLVGNIGGIVISHVEGREENFARGLRQAPAAIIRDNTVVSPEGRALELIGSGQMLVQSNALTSHGNNSLGILRLSFGDQQRDQRLPGGSLTESTGQSQLRAFMAQLLGSCVAILNTGINPNLTNLQNAFRTSQAAGQAPSFQANIPARNLSPKGPVLFNDNQVTFDAFVADTLSLCSIGILSLDDIGMQDNQCMVDAFEDLVLINALVIGLVSTRVQGNRFREIVNPRLIDDDDDEEPTLPLSTFLSALTFGVLNATEMNQGTHCFVTLGVKQPRVVDPSSNRRFVLDSNRHLVPEDFCSRFGFGRVDEEG